MSLSDGDILRLVTSFLLPDSVIAQMVFNVAFADTGGSAEEIDVVDDLVDWAEAMLTHLLTRIVPECTTTDVKVYVYDAVDDDWDEVGTDTWSVTFTNASEMLPHGIAAVVHARTINPDVQGTKFIPGLGEATQVESDLSVGILADLVDFAAEWVAPFVGAATGADFAPLIWSVVRTTPILMSGDTVVNAQVGYQRRRKPGVGI